MSAYSLEARIIQKKDQLEELSATGAIIPTPIVEEVRTGQQFLIKLHLLRHGNAGSHMPLRFPSLRVGRRVAINTAGEPRTEHEPLTLEIGVHLAKSGQYGPHSAILVLLDPLSPSATDSTNYAHIDTTTGSITMLAKVICSSTDHGERGNKDRYIFEFKLKRTSSMVAVTQSQVASSSSTSSEAPEDEGETLSVCFTHPIMCSGHHKAKRAYPNQRPVKVTKAGPTPKTKAIKRYKSAPNIAMPSMETHHPESLAGPSHMMAHNHSGYPSTMTYLPDHLSQAMEPYASRSTSTDLRSGSDQPFVSPPEAPRIIEVRPDRGPIRKRTDVIIRGLYFREGMVPYFGCFPALDISVETANLIVCKAPESSLPGTVAISIYDHMANNFADLAQFTYTDDGETELLVLQLELRLAHRALEYLHKQATGQNGNATDIMKGIPGLAGSPQSGHTMMMMEGVYSATSDSDMPMMTPSQVEDSLLDTLNNLPKEVDISMQLEDGSNLLHLSILLGFNRLAFRLIDEGCDLEALDMYSLTPLMYAVLQRNEAVTRHLVVAGATSSGARTPREFYARLPREIEPTQTMYRYLSVSCTRFFNATISPSAFLSGIIEEQEADMDRVHPQGDGVGDEVESEEWASQGGESESSSHATRMPLTALSMAGLTRSSTTTISDPLSARSTSSTASKDFTRLAEAIQSVDINSPEQRDDEVVKKSDVQSANTEGGDRQWWQRRQYDDIAGIVRDSNAEPGLTSDLSNAIPESSYSIESRTDVNSESGYHSGVVPEVQEYLNRIQMATLPSEGVKMEVLFKRLPQSAPPAAPVSARPQSTIPLELFRTGDSFAIEIKLTTPPSLSSHSAFEDIHSQTQHAGIRFPKEMVRRSNGRQAFVLGKMTYHLNVSIELGDLNIPIDQFFGQDKNNSCHRDGEAAAACRSFGDGIPLSSACEACSKFLHEHNSLSPSRRSTIDPTIYPILQFSVPGSASYSTAMTSLLPSSPSSSPPKSTGFAQQQQQSTNTVNDSGVMELRDGICEVRGRVNCSSLHHLIQRERTKCEAELRQQHRQREERDLSSSPRSSSSKASDAAPRRSLALTDLIDPGYVFKFELVHPISMDVVARYETKPILFQSYSRRRT
ncbi:SPT3 Dosage dependent suppressor of Ty-induced promoter mutations-like protein [Mortierella sp. GBA43]|nr:SPT3 Dosage dependent suppressor of Ty-induced promoter mutations-like protein [Mortierella sp. GBA43]